MRNLQTPANIKETFSAQVAITIYTDGSCHTQLKLGAWAAIILHGDEKKIMTGTARETTHQRMELTAAIEAIKFVQLYYPSTTAINLISDSQYVVDLPVRMHTISIKNFCNKQGKPIQNAIFVQQLFQLCKSSNIIFIKVKAHLKKTGLDDYNIEVDKLCRKFVREQVNGIIAS